MNIEKKLYYEKLYNVYNVLLTDKQKFTFENYYFEDYSINEIAFELNITKNAVYNSIKSVEIQLENLESNLKIILNYDFNIKLLNENNVSIEVIKKIK